jgi:hypothetical protein
MSRLHSRIDKLENSQQPDEPNPLAALAAWAVSKVYNGAEADPPELDENIQMVRRFLRQLVIAYGSKTE